MKKSEKLTTLNHKNQHLAAMLMAKNQTYRILIATHWQILRKGRKTLLVISHLGEIEINPGFIAFISFDSSQFPSYSYRFTELEPASWLHQLYQDRKINMSFPIHN